MCIVSMIFDYGQQQWPYYPAPNTAPSLPYAPPITPVVPLAPGPTPEQWKEFLELVEKAKKFDELTGQADCEDPEKARWMAGIEQRLSAVEKKSRRDKK